MIDGGQDARGGVLWADAPRSGGLAVHVAKGPIGRSVALFGVTPIDALTVRR